MLSVSIGSADIPIPVLNVCRMAIKSTAYKLIKIQKTIRFSRIDLRLNNCKTYLIAASRSACVTNLIKSTQKIDGRMSVPILRTAQYCYAIRFSYHRNERYICSMWQ